MSPLLLPPHYARRQRGFIINPYAYATGGAPSNTTALLHFNAADGSTTFDDEYFNTWAVPTGGVAVIETGSSPFSPKFGSAALLSATNGAGNKGGILMQNASMLSFGNGDFTIDVQVYALQDFGTDNATNPFLFWANTKASGASNPYPPITVARNNFTELLVYCSSSGSGWIGGAPVISTGTLAFGNSAWKHVEVCRSGSDLRLFVDGVQKGSTYNIGSTSLCSSDGFNLGGVYDGIGFPNFSHVGGFDELYIRKGTAAHTANFTPPSAAYSPP